MSLHPCPECDKPISQHAKTCPSCGCPVDPSAPSPLHQRATAMLRTGAKVPTVCKTTGLPVSDVVALQTAIREEAKEGGNRTMNGIIGLAIGLACIAAGIAGAGWISTIIGIGCVISGAINLGKRA